MNITTKRKEAISRMKTLGLSASVIEQFEKGTVSGSVDGDIKPLGDRTISFIKGFEEMHNAVVYHVIFEENPLGIMMCVLFVGDYREDWAHERQINKRGDTFVWVENLTRPICSEFGQIGVAPTLGGGLARLY